jgi:myo-inositol-1(or 4)-monophosphatase
MNDRQLAIKAVKEAGRIAVAGFGKRHRITEKSAHDFMTEVDMRAERRMLSVLKPSGHSVLGEETGKHTGESGCMWIVDPLDGTTNYSVRNPFFDVSVALVRGGDVVMGATYAPMTGDMFFAEKGKGFFLNGRRARVSGRSAIPKSLLVYCHGNSRKDIGRAIKVFSKLKPVARDVSRMRAGALELALVAAGKLEAYISPGSRPWDVAAGALFVREAGGKVTDFRGNRWDIGKHDILATNGRVHSGIANKIKSI